MNKKANTLLFILGATLFNILVIIVSFLLLLFLYYNLVAPMLPPESDQSFGLIFVFVGAIVISIVLYRFIMKKLIAKIDIEKYFDPIFAKKNLKKP